MSFICTGGKVRAVDAPGLPVGILEKAQFHCAQEELQDGDLLVMVSDGALCDGTAWICSLLEKPGDAKTPQELAEAVVAGAVARRKDGHDDDVTAVVLRIQSYRPAVKS